MNIDALDRRIQTDIGKRAEEIAFEREVRVREIADLSSALQSLKTSFGDAQTFHTQRDETRASDLEILATRVSELGEAILTVRSEFMKHQDYLDSWQGFQVDKITGEMRRLVNDVHKLSGDLDSEVAARSLRDSEFRSHLEREAREFAHRIDLLTVTANCHDPSGEKVVSSPQSLSTMSTRGSVARMSLTASTSRASAFAPRGLSKGTSLETLYMSS